LWNLRIAVGSWSPSHGRLTGIDEPDAKQRIFLEEIQRACDEGHFVPSEANGGIVKFRLVDAAGPILRTARGNDGRLYCSIAARDLQVQHLMRKVATDPALAVPALAIIFKGRGGPSR